MSSSQATDPSARIFHERGMAVPFTTPSLAHARVRPAAGNGLELLVPNVGGGKGTYVVDLGGVGALFSLTVHDRLLIEAVGKLSEPTPHEIRRVVRETAASGIAGRAVRRAAETAQADDAASKARLEVTLIRHLLGAVGVEAVDPELAGASGEALHAGLGTRLIEAAARLRSTPDELLEIVGQIAEAAVHVGAPDAETPSRNERRIEQLAHFVDSVRAWDGDPSDGGPAAAVIGGAERRLVEARQSHEAARALLGDALRLAIRWRAKPEAAAQHLEWTDWLLDGWPEICVTWEAVARDERSVQRATLARIELLLPLLGLTPPRSARGTINDPAQHPQRVRLNEDWRSGLMLTAETGRSEARKAVAA